MIPGFSNRETILVGVHRQYTGTAGKVTNCQVGVSLEIATASQHAPIDFELYLPEKWTEDAERRAKARIPDEVVFKTKIELALGMIERAARAEIPGEIVLADSAYGSSAALRQGIVSLGFDYAVGIGNQTKVRRVGSNERLGTAMGSGSGQNHPSSKAPAAALEGGHEKYAERSLLLLPGQDAARGWRPHRGA